ncbi:uncharacterized protein LOC144128519 [Amblyomma americanum]
MPGCCCAPGCRSNYDGGPSVRVYKFPADETQRAAWTKAISREDFVPTKHTVVCEKHFQTSDFVRFATYTDENTGNVIEVPLQRVRLKPAAVPSVFPGCPKYLSQPPSSREAPAEKKARLEAASLRKAIELSVAAQEEEDRRNKICSFGELCSALSKLKTSDFWTVVTTQAKVLFLELSLDQAPAVRSSVVVLDDLSVQVFLGGSRLHNLGDECVPSQIKDLRELDKVLQSVEKLQSCASGSEKEHQLLATVLMLLDEVNKDYELQEHHGWNLQVLKFVRSQVELVLKNVPRYPPDVLVFSGLLYTISPHVYRFIRSSLKIKLPHPDTIRRLCSSYHMNPALEQQDPCFLNYAKTVLPREL